MNIAIARHRTAIRRGGSLSTPVQRALDAGLISSDVSFFDYGCGLGEDLHLLSGLGITCGGWDPVHQPGVRPCAASVVNLGYVVNVIENAIERSETLLKAWGLAERLLIVAARLGFDSKSTRSTEFGDGNITSRGTFQKFYTQTELREWIVVTLGVDPVPAAPGVFFVFRDTELRQVYLSQRYRRRRSAPRVTKSERLYEEYRELLDVLASFMANHSRLPAAWELPESSELVNVFGSIKKAFSVIRRITGPEQWAAIRQERIGELLLQLALERFTGRSRFTDRSRSIQLDIRAFFSSYKNACSQADALLFQAGDMSAIETAMTNTCVGKRTGNALYVQSDALHHLPYLLRVYEGCAKAYIGDMVEANVIKLHRHSPRVSYLTYSDFDKDPHPILQESFLVKMGALKVSYRDYGAYRNPPILHRKEELIHKDDKRWPMFHRLTKQEERWGLYDHTEEIGTVMGWQETLLKHQARLRGHRLVRVKAAEPFVEIEGSTNVTTQNKI